jgi:hypothetical protein
MKYFIGCLWILIFLFSCTPKWNPQKYRLAEITDAGEIYSTLNLEKRNDNNVPIYRKRLMKKRWIPDSLFRTISGNCTEAKWPAGIKTPQLRQENRLRMRQYRTYIVTHFKGKYLLYIPKSENKNLKNMPNEMLPANDLYMIVGKRGVTKKDEYILGYENWKRSPRKKRKEETRIEPKTSTPSPKGGTKPDSKTPVSTAPSINSPKDDIRIKEK